MNLEAVSRKKKMVQAYTPTSLQDSITSVCKTILPFSFKKRRMPAIEQRLSKEQSDNLKWQQNSFHQMLNLMGLCREGIVPKNDVSAFRVHLLETLIASPVHHEPPSILRDKLIFLQELLYAKCISDEEYHASKRPLLQRLAVQGAEIDVRSVIVGEKKETSNDEWSEIDLKDDNQESISTSKSSSKGSFAVKRMKGAAFGFVSPNISEKLKDNGANNAFLNGGSDEKENGFKSILMEESLQSSACAMGEKKKKNAGGTGKKAALRAAFEREKVKLGKRGWGFDGFKKWRKNESKDEEIAPSPSPSPSPSTEESYGGKLVSNPVGEGPDTRQIKRKLHPNGAPTDFFVDKVVAENIKKQLSRIRTEISAANSDARLTDDEIEAISTKLPVDKADLNKLFPRSWCDQYGDVVLDVVRKEFKEHMREMGNHRGDRGENSHPNLVSINSTSSIDKGFKYNPFFDL